MNDEVYEEMFRVESRHWWFRAKHKIVAGLLRRYAPATSTRQPRLIDLGCGCGYLLSLLKNEYDAVGLDGSEQAVTFSAQRGVDVRRGSLPDEVPFGDASADVILMLDVLEHLRDDGTCFDRAARLLKPGGIAICTVPAYPWLWTRRDEFHQHFRRYTRPQFVTLMNRGPMRSEFVRHMNAALFPVAQVLEHVEHQDHIG
ncbi:class I SAM-dependent methyltransferase [bacterium]|nr:MAG: class I SAM-dependent methyltransferase [bacterium]